MTVHQLINGESAVKTSWYVIEFVWDNVWELSELAHFIKLSPICQPLSPRRTAAGKRSIPKKLKSIVQPFSIVRQHYLFRNGKFKIQSILFTCPKALSFLTGSDLLSPASRWRVDS
ncbi:MAG: hypothetical protein JKY23_03785 [Nitrospinaceae bacterium]|nr:hypothetical protein [Nitrospinaceae bacterium]